MVVDLNLVCDPTSQLRWLPWHQTGMTADGQVSYVLNRCASNPCGGGCDIGQVSFALSYDGRTDAGKNAGIAYTKTHHNFDDSLVVTLPDRVLKWRVVGVFPPGSGIKLKFFVRVDTLDGAPILAETEAITDVCKPKHSCAIYQ